MAAPTDPAVPADPAPAAPPAPAALALVGPTASGKTGLSLRVARLLGAEIVSMDSRAVFRGMDVGTAKPSPRERAAVPHHGIDLVEPSERFSAARWAAYARTKIEEIRGRGGVPLLVGGTGFFLRALTHPIFREPRLDPGARRLLEAEHAGLTDEALLEKLRPLDPESAERLSRSGGRQRLLRALELPLLTGYPLTWWHRHAPPEHPAVPVLPVVLDVPRARLDETVDRRVDEMVEAGLVDEVRALVDRYGADAPGLNAHGYAELIPYLAGARTLDEALALVRKNTRAYTRRQRTWFRTQLPPGAVWLDATRPADELAGEIARAWRAAETITDGTDEEQP